MQNPKALIFNLTIDAQGFNFPTNQVLVIGKQNSFTIILGTYFSSFPQSGIKICYTRIVAGVEVLSLIRLLLTRNEDDDSPRNILPHKSIGAALHRSKVLIPDQVDSDVTLKCVRYVYGQCQHELSCLCQPNKHDKYQPKQLNFLVYAYGSDCSKLRVMESLTPSPYAKYPKKPMVKYKKVIVDMPTLRTPNGAGKHLGSFISFSSGIT